MAITWPHHAADCPHSAPFAAALGEHLSVVCKQCGTRWNETNAPDAVRAILAAVLPDMGRHGGEQ